MSYRLGLGTIFNIVSIGLSLLYYQPQASAQDCADPPPDLVSWWTGDGNGSDLQGEHDGTLHGDVAAAFPGQVAGAFRFDTAGGYIEVPDDPGLDVGTNGEFTVDAWVNVDPGAITDVNAVVVWKWGEGEGSGLTAGYRLGVLPSGEIFVTIRPEGGISHTFPTVGMSIDDGGWHHIAGMRRVAGSNATVRLYIDGQLARSEIVPSGSLANTAAVSIGDYATAPGTHRFVGLIDELDFFSRSLTDGEILAIYDADSAGKCKPGPVLTVLSGHVLADCPAPNTGLQGVKLAVYGADAGDLLVSAVTGSDGAYEVDGLLAGDYIVTLVTPLGYFAPVEQHTVTLTGGADPEVNFSCECVSVAAEPRSRGYWKHEISRLVKNLEKGEDKPTDYAAEEIMELLAVVDAHFGQNAVNPILLYDASGASTQLDSLGVLQTLISAKEGEGETDTDKKLRKARAELMTLLLNVAAGKLAQTASISEDGATVSQAITFASTCVTASVTCSDADAEADEDRDEEACVCDHKKAEKILKKINAGKQVGVGLIPLDTQMITYRVVPRVHAVTRLLGVAPTPFKAGTTVRFELARTLQVTVRIYDVGGKLVRDLVDGSWPAGEHHAVWEGRDDLGRPVSQGVYYLRLQAGGYRDTKRVVMFR